MNRVRSTLIVLAVSAFAKCLSAQGTPGRALTLADLEQRILANNPVDAKARAAVSAATARADQAGRYPNPQIGVTGDDISDNQVLRGGAYGAFVEQRVVTGGKLHWARQVARQDQSLMEIERGTRRQELLNRVRSLYYQALGEQRLIEVEQKLSTLARDVIQVAQELKNIGQADEPDALESEVEAERLEIGLAQAHNAQQRTWAALAAALNDPALHIQPLAGDLEAIPRLDKEKALAGILSDSPEIKTALAAEQRASLDVHRALSQRIPDITLQAGVRYNRELLDLDTSLSARPPIGVTGSFTATVELPLFNRNQGGIAAARADAERAKINVDLKKLSLQARLAEAWRQYQDAVTTADRYHTRMIPKAQRAYDLYLANFRQMAAAYPQVLITQRNLFTLQEAYIRQLVIVWQRAITIQGFLLNGQEWSDPASSDFSDANLPN